MKVINFILGIFSVFVGIYCFFGLNTLVNIGWLIGCMLGIWGIIAIVSFFINLKKGNNDGAKAGEGVFGLILGIAAVVICFFTNISDTFDASITIILMITIAVWLIIDGILTLVSSFSIKKASEGHGAWGFFLAIGILMIVVGIAALCNFFFLKFLTELYAIFLGIMVVIFGVRLIMSVFDSRKTSDDYISD